MCVSVCSPVLTWRDVQHIIVKTSRAGHLNAPDWKTNAAGYNGEAPPLCGLGGAHTAPLRVCAFYIVLCERLCAFYIVLCVV